MSGTYILRKGVAQLTDLQDGIEAALPPWRGSTFYVNGTTWGSPAGHDDNPGTKDEPFQSIDFALGKCTAEADDYIIVTDYWTGNSETKPITVDVDNVHIIGRGMGTYGMPWPIVYVTATASFNITASMVEIAGFHCYGGASSGCIEVSASAKGINIHHNTFGERTTGQDGIRLATAIDPAEIYIHDNMFGAQLSRYGVYIINTSTWGRINNNSFVSVPNVNIYCPTAGAVLAEIRDNRFAQHANTEGIAITVAGNNCLIDGNRAGFGVTAPNATPYKDTGSNDWLLNYIKGITASMPAT